MAALASWLDARAHAGTWLVRIEDLDPPREMPGAASRILRDLSSFGLESDEPVVRQSERDAAFQDAFDRLRAGGWIFPCICSRSDIRSASHAFTGSREGAYPGTCRQRTTAEGKLRSWRFRVESGIVEFSDRWAGSYEQDVAREVGDFVVRRGDGLWAYQLAVVVDDAEQRVTDVVRGDDLIDNTPRQLLLQRALGAATPRYLHVPVVTGADGQKLSKQTQAHPLDSSRAVDELERAVAHLQLPHIGATNIEAFLRAATTAWKEHVLGSS